MGRLWRVLKAAVSGFQANDALSRGAAIAFYAATSRGVGRPRITGERIQAEPNANQDVGHAMMGGALENYEFMVFGFWCRP
jgi:hypothetical protein